MLRLLSGLTGYDDSQYREWLLANKPLQGQAGSSDELSWHGWSQTLMLILDMRNMLAADLNSRRDEQAGGDPLPMLKAPEAKVPQQDHADSLLDEMAREFGALTLKPPAKH